MREHPMKLDEIVLWYRSKQDLLTNTGISLTDVRERTEHLSAAGADFNGPDSMGRINGWVSGEFDFEVVRVSDGRDLFWRHVTISACNELEAVYDEFLLAMLGNSGADGT